MAIIYEKATGQPSDHTRTGAWGNFTRYLKIGEDLLALRQVDLYENGHCLRYDRRNWADDFGTLAAMMYDAELFAAWWGPAERITPTEFKRVWSTSASAPNQPQQYLFDGKEWPVLRQG